MAKDTADYEGSERMAIASGKRAILRAPWLHDRAVDKTKGSFVELRRNDIVHPKYFAVHVVDGVGTKLFLCPWSGDYRQQPVDGIAMNANDLATIINAFPDVINIYLACQTGVEENHMEEIMDGFVDALERISIPGARWDINVGKIETASLDEMISLGVPNKGVDYGIVMTGYIAKDKVPNLAPKPGHFIVGVSSTGLHSNGFTGARHVLFKPLVEYREEWKGQYKGSFGLDDKPDILEGKTVLEAMQVHTALYLVEAARIGQKFDNKDIYGVNITGNGLHNFNRIGHGVSFEITDPLPMLPIHELLAQESGWDPKTSYKKQNNGMGFAYVVPTQKIAEGIVDLINDRGENRAKIVGEVKTSNVSQLVTILHKPYEGERPLEFVGYNN